VTDLSLQMLEKMENLAESALITPHQKSPSPAADPDQGF
jgi:hypothetical protein